MTIDKPRKSNLARAKSRLLNSAGMVFSPPPIARKVLIRAEQDNVIRVSLWPSVHGVPDQLFKDRHEAAIYGTLLKLEYCAELDNA